MWHFCKYNLTSCFVDKSSGFFFYLLCFHSFFWILWSKAKCVVLETFLSVEKCSFVTWRLVLKMSSLQGCSIGKNLHLPISFYWIRILHRSVLFVSIFTSYFEFSSSFHLYLRMCSSNCKPFSSLLLLHSNILLHYLKSVICNVKLVPFCHWGYHHLWAKRSSLMLLIGATCDQ